MNKQDKTQRDEMQRHEVDEEKASILTHLNALRRMLMISAGTVLAAFVWLTAQMGLALGLCLPNLHWVSEAAVVKRSAASMLAMFGGWLLAGGVLFLPLTLLDYAVPPLAAQGACLAALLGLDLLLHRWLCTRGAARFAALH